MSLKQDVVIVNEYTVISPRTGGASRGATPGSFVTRYMARPKATETVTPIRRDLENYTTRYMARDSAVDHAISVRSAKKEMAEFIGKGGVAFGYGEVSLSDRQLKSASDDIQTLFDAGKTVMKTVISFDEDYLRKRGIIEPDFRCESPGDYRGNIDQLKLRMAVMAGMNRMSQDYDDLRYVAVIQVDTRHVHVHLAAVDAGRGNLTADGTQKGKISPRSMSLLRRGMDSWLDEKQVVKHMSSQVGFERRNVTTYIKRWTHSQIAKESLPQLLIATLPEDRSLWRAGSNRRDMRKANTLTRSVVEEVLARPGSPMNAAMAQIIRYADERQLNEGLSENERARLIRDGRASIVDGCVNGIYGMLRSLPEDQLSVRTPLLNAMSMDMTEVVHQAKQEDKPDPLMDFAYKLRSYSTRLNHHREQREHYHEQAAVWEGARKAGVASDSSRVLYEFYLEEEEYHAQCMAKYQWFLPFRPASADWYKRWDEVAEYGSAILSLEMMSGDASLKATADRQEAEERGREIYGQSGGALVAGGEDGRRLLRERIERMREKFDRDVEELRVELSGRGLQMAAVELPEPATVTSTDIERPQMTPGTEYPFDQVKGLDMHHMRYDFTSDVPVGVKVRQSFVDRARERRERLEAAVGYLISSGQPEQVATLPVTDVAGMNDLADQLEPMEQPSLRSRIAELARRAGESLRRRSRTVRVGTMAQRVNQEVDTQVVATLRQMIPIEPQEHEVEQVEARALDAVELGG